MINISKYYIFLTGLHWQFEFKYACNQLYMFYIIQGDDNCDGENDCCSTDDNDDKRNMSYSDYEDSTDDEHRESGGSYKTYYIEYTVYI